MSLFTDRRTIAVSDGESSYGSSVAGRRAAVDTYGRPRRYVDGYNSHRDSDTSAHSSVDELVRRTLRQGYTKLERHLSTTVGLHGSPFRPARDIAIEGASSPSSSADSAEAAREAAFLQRLHRGLVEMRMREKPGGHVGAVAPIRKVKVDKATFARLTKPNASVAAKMQEKYEKRVEREQMEKRKPVHVSKVATRAGQRLHLQAMGHKRALERAQKEAAESAAAKRDDECTFQPAITSMARRLGGDDYRLVRDRLGEFKSRQEERDRRRLERQAEELQQLPFRPTLSAGTRQLMEQRRGRSRSRSRSRSGGRRPHSRHRRTSDKAGERLYRDGGERLLRQQMRQRLAEREQQADVVGGGVRLTEGRQLQVSDRLGAWLQSREAHVAQLRAEAERIRDEGRVGRERGGTARSGMARTPSCAGSAGVAVPPPRSRRPQSPTVPNDAGTAPTEGLRSDPFAAFSPQQRALYAELRRVRFGALFYKYTAGSPSETVTLSQVRRVVELLYPEDAGVVEALCTSVGAHAQASLSKPAFIDALLDYERAHGPQPWARTAKDALLFPPPTPAAPPGPVAGPPARAASVPPRGGESSGGGAGASPAAEGAGEEAKGAVHRSARGQTAAASTARNGRSASAPSRRGSDAAAPTAAPRAGVAGTGHRAHTPASGRGSSPCVSRAGPHAACVPVDECTFAPLLSRRTERLSRVDLERRAGYAVERELRRRELALLRTRHQPPHPGDSAAAAMACPSPSGSLVSGRGRAVSVAETVAAEPGGSCDVSSLTGSLGRSPTPARAPPPLRDGSRPPLASSGAPARVPVARSPAASAAARALDDLQALLDAAEPPQARPGPTPAPAVAPASAPTVTRIPQPASAQTPKTLPAAAQRRSQEAARGTPGSGRPAFTEEGVDEMLDAMYRKGPRSAWF